MEQGALVRFHLHNLSRLALGQKPSPAHSAVVKEDLRLYCIVLHYGSGDGTEKCLGEICHRYGQKGCIHTDKIAAALNSQRGLFLDKGSPFYSRPSRLLRYCKYGKNECHQGQHHRSEGYIYITHAHAYTTN